MKNKTNINWEAFSENVEKVLGEDFWNEMQHVIPKRGPAYDYFETEQEGVILIDLPGFTTSDTVHLSQQGTRLIVKGELKYPYPIPEKELIHSERLKGKFKRIITVPFHFTSENIQTSLQHGVLIIKITKMAEEEIVVRIHDQ
ncbi:Hsp20/alpha crystallin family protein [Halobacillus mangrovi]|uniref:Heat-shock protein Hsp20 n=1 Tax=Halobacillus mangrovi TaxID=402384 RepID=A0A1W5ZS43_9BACI|nr:Hsp20/alpha crystallin family protein [Halobacillus mangrovi]ARI76114.1 heat-shock protein Hsp20 [Halobacillus mangrovi]